MNNLIAEMEYGLQGKRIGLTTGSPMLDRMTLGIRHGTSWLIAAKEKVGKSKWTRFHLLVEPYLKGILGGAKEVRWIYFSLEEPRVKVEADVCSALIYKEYGISISRNKMLGTYLDEEGMPVFLDAGEQAIVRDTYKKHIIPLFGEHCPDSGEQLTPGLIEFYETDITPAKYEGILIDYAERHGEIVYKTVKEKVGNSLVDRKIISNFIPSDDTLPVVIMDDYRLLDGVGSKKEIIDSAFQIEVSLTQKFKWFFFAGIMHLNRDNLNYKRIESIGKNRYYPDSSLVKDSGNGGERKHTVITLFNPMDPGFDCDTHFNYELPEDNTYRSVHLVASRDTPYPQHLRTSFEAEHIHFVNYERIEV